MKSAVAILINAGSSWADVAGGIGFVLAGIVALLIGVFGKKLKFYEGDALTMSSYKRERQVSNWFGRLIFILVGASFIAFGVMAFFGRVSWSDN